MGLQMRQQVFEDRLFDGFTLGCGFDDQIGLTQILQAHRGFDPRQCFCLFSTRDFAARYLSVHVLTHQFHGCIQRVLGDIVEQHIVSGQCHHMCNPIAHLACAYNSDRPDVHDPPPTCLNHNRSAAQRAARPVGRERLSQIRTLSESKYYRAKVLAG